LIRHEYARTEGGDPPHAQAISQVQVKTATRCIATHNKFDSMEAVSNATEA
jgi:hypothetical protein